MSQDTPEYRKRIKTHEEAAEGYTRRKADKHAAEMALIERGFALCSEVKTALDAPCGVGRATVWMARQGYQATGIDLGEAAVEYTRKAFTEAGVDGDAHQMDVENTDFADRAFDAVLCFRLLHHFPDPEPRRRLIRELCRVSDRYVLISYISPWSVTSIRRRIQRLFGKRLKQFHTPLSEVRAYFAEQGFSLVDDLPQQRFLHSLHLAVFRRD
jgi:2-polyprenyl-3-methyl-5-hydroxy-6-metoxy-1,4-benzoquinol methylase